jgi:hypothetical protein
MQDGENPTLLASKRIPWNKGKLTGAKPPLRPKRAEAKRPSVSEGPPPARAGGDIPVRLTKHSWKEVFHHPFRNRPPSPH